MPSIYSTLNVLKNAVYFVLPVWMRITKASIHQVIVIMLHHQQLLPFNIGWKGQMWILSTQLNLTCVEVNDISEGDVNSEFCTTQRSPRHSYSTSKTSKCQSSNQDSQSKQNLRSKKIEMDLLKQSLALRLREKKRSEHAFQTSRNFNDTWVQIPKYSGKQFNSNNCDETAKKNHLLSKL